MKRQYKKTYEMLWSHIPLFQWKQCCSCKKEFRRERGWRGLGFPVRNRMYTEYFLCSECAPTFEQAQEFFISEKYLEEFRNSRPKYPPPPPPAKNRKQFTWDSVDEWIEHYKANGGDMRGFAYPIVEAAFKAGREAR